MLSGDMHASTLNTLVSHVKSYLKKTQSWQISPKQKMFKKYFATESSNALKRANHVPHVHSTTPSELEVCSVWLVANGG